MTPKIEIFALRKFHKRPATEEELKTTRPIFKKGELPKGKIGILFLHGFTSTPASLQDYAEFFAKEGYTVSVPLLPGHGGIPADLIKISWEQWLEKTLESYEELNEICSKIFVVGLSLGGTLALQLAAKRKGIPKLFLLSPAVYPKPFFRRANALYLPLVGFCGLKYWIHIGGDIKNPQSFELGYQWAALNGMKQLNACMKQTQKILPRVKTSTLIFQPKIDHVNPTKRTIKIWERLGSKEKDLVWLENSYHAIPQDFKANFVRDRIAEEIKGTLT